MYYQGYSSGGRVSGAYVFRTTDKQAKLITSEKLEVKFIKGKLVDEVLQVYSPEVSQVIRVYKDDSGFIEFDWLVGNLQQ